MGRFFLIIVLFSIICTLWNVSINVGQHVVRIQLYEYRKIPIISHRLLFVQNAFLVGLFSRKLIVGGGYY